MSEHTQYPKESKKETILGIVGPIVAVVIIAAVILLLKHING